MTFQILTPGDYHTDRAHRELWQLSRRPLHTRRHERWQPVLEALSLGRQTIRFRYDEATITSAPPASEPEGNQ